MIPDTCIRQKYKPSTLIFDLLPRLSSGYKQEPERSRRICPGYPRDSVDGEARCVQCAAAPTDVPLFITFHLSL